jgi:hypothetical protein
MQQPKIKIQTTGIAISYIILLTDHILKTALNEQDKMHAIFQIMLLKFKLKYEGKYNENSKEKVTITLKLEIALAVLDLLEDGVSTNPHVAAYLSEAYNSLKKEYKNFIESVNKKPHAIAQG